MRSSLLPRFSGLALIAGGAIGTFAQAFHPAEVTDPLTVPLHLVLFFGVVLVLLGLPEVLGRQEGRAGAPGLIGGTMAFFGIAMFDLPHTVLVFSLVPALSGDASLRPLLDEGSPLLTGIDQSPFGIVNSAARLLMLFGLPLLGITILRTRTLPRWTGLVILGGIAGILVSIVVPALQTLPIGVLLYVQPLALGCALLAEKGSAPQHAMVRTTPIVVPSGD
jgi:hypothetical protein